MKWRYRKSVKLFPGVRVNLSHKGISTTAGIRGLASVNIGPGGTHLNLGVPGSGLSSRTKLGGPAPQMRQQPTTLPPRAQSAFHAPSEEAGVIKSAAPEELTSEGLAGLKGMLREAFAEHAELRREASSAWQDLNARQERRRRLEGSFIARTFRKKAVAEAVAASEEAQAKFDELNEQLGLCVVRVENSFEGDIKAGFEELLKAFGEVVRCAVIWDKTSSVGVSISERSAAGRAVNRVPLRFDLRHIPIIASPTPAMHLMNANGGDIYLYPGFVLVTGQTDFALIDYRDVEVVPDNVTFIEEEAVPADTRVVGSTWAKVNKDGSPDRRFKNNYEIPIVLYGSLTLRSDAGLHEVYMFSNSQAGLTFGRALLKYKSLITSLPGACS